MRRLALLTWSLVFFFGACTDSSPLPKGGDAGTQEATPDAAAVADAGADKAPDSLPDTSPDAHAADAVAADVVGDDAKVGGDAPPASDVRPDLGGDAQPLRVPTSYEVLGDLALKSSQPGGGLGPTPGAGLPNKHDFHLSVAPDAGSLVVFANGKASRVGTTTSDGITFKAAANVSLSLLAGTCGGSATYSTFTFTVDSASGTVNGTAEGTAQIFQSDVAYAYNAELKFTGTLDKTGPTVSVPAELDPLRLPELRASEPLLASTTARLVLGKELVELAPVTSGGVVTGFAVPATVALRYGARYEVVISPWRDLVGNAGQALAAVATMAAPPLVAEDGFEGPGPTAGGATLVGAAMIPPLKGQQSAAIIASYVGQAKVAGLAPSRLSARLAVKTGDTVVRLLARPMASTPFTTAFSASLRVAAPGGAVRKATLPLEEKVDMRFEFATAGTLYMGETRTIELPLPAGTTDEVVVDFDAGTDTGACGLQPLMASYLIDDLRVE